MHKKVLIAGLVGAIVLLAWTVVIDVLLGFNARFTMKQLPDERAVYSILRTTVAEPGRYLCNPALTPDGRFPDGEPVFGVQYAGVGHEAAGIGAIVDLLKFLIVPLIAAWMLSKTSEQYRSHFLSRLGFFVVIGLLLAITGDLSSFGIGGSPLTLAVLFAARTVATWIVVGLAVAALMRPVRLIDSTE